MRLMELFKFKARKMTKKLPKPELVEICTYTVGDLEGREDLILINTDYEVKALKKILGDFPELDEFKSFLVRIEDGEYKEIYGIPSEIPHLNEVACRLRVKLGNKFIYG